MRERPWARCTRCKATQTADVTPKSAVETRAFPWLGRRMGLTGWTPYPCSSAGADAPCGPFAALGQTPSTCAFSAPQTRTASGLILLSERVCPTAVGAGAVRPRTAVPALGGLSAEGLAPCRLPLAHVPSWGPGRCSGRLPCAALAGALRALGRSAALTPASAVFQALARAHVLAVTSNLPSSPPSPRTSHRSLDIRFLGTAHQATRYAGLMSDVSPWYAFTT